MTLIPSWYRCQVETPKKTNNKTKQNKPKQKQDDTEIQALALRVREVTTQGNTDATCTNAQKLALFLLK